MFSTANAVSLLFCSSYLFYFKTDKNLNERVRVHNLQIRHLKLRQIPICEHLDICSNGNFKMMPFYKCQSNDEELRLAKKLYFWELSNLNWIRLWRHWRKMNIINLFITHFWWRIILSFIFFNLNFIMQIITQIVNLWKANFSYRALFCLYKDKRKINPSFCWISVSKNNLVVILTKLHN